MSIGAAVKEAVKWGFDEHWKLELTEQEQSAHYRNLIAHDSALSDSIKMRLIEESTGDLRRFRQEGFVYPA